MRKKDLVAGDEYIISIEGKQAHARLIAIRSNWYGQEHLMEITRSPDLPKRGGRWMYEVGSRTEVTSVSIKYPLNFVIKEEDDDPAWA